MRQATKPHFVPRFVPRFALRYPPPIGLCVWHALRDSDEMAGRVVALALQWLGFTLVLWVVIRFR